MCQYVSIIINNAAVYNYTSLHQCSFLTSSWSQSKFLVYKILHSCLFFTLTYLHTPQPLRTSRHYHPCNLIVPHSLCSLIVLQLFRSLQLFSQSPLLLNPSPPLLNLSAWYQMFLTSFCMFFILAIGYEHLFVALQK